MKILKLNREKIVSLNGSEMQSIKAGAEKRSDRLNGDCRYSKMHPDGHWEDTNGNGCDELIVTGCRESRNVSF